MSQIIVSRAQAREIDRRATAEYGIASLVLMENAGRGVVDCLCRAGISGPVTVCCGKGNNAGDGFVIARHLQLRGHDVRTIVWADPAELTGDAGVNFAILRKTGVPLEIVAPGSDPLAKGDWIRDADWIVDALLGTGARGEPRPPLDVVIDAINAAPARRLAVDLPSGLDCDTGQPAAHTVRASLTCTFVGLKPGFLSPAAEPYLGTVQTLDIGVPPKLIQETLDAGPCR